MSKHSRIGVYRLAGDFGKLASYSGTSKAKRWNRRYFDKYRIRRTKGEHTTIVVSCVEV